MNTSLTPSMTRALNRLRADKANADANDAPSLAFSGGYNLNTIAALRARGFNIVDRPTYFGTQFAIS